MKLLYQLSVYACLWITASVAGDLKIARAAASIHAAAHKAPEKIKAPTNIDDVPRWCMSMIRALEGPEAPAYIQCPQDGLPTILMIINENANVGLDESAQRHLAIPQPDDVYDEEERVKLRNTVELYKSPQPIQGDKSIEVVSKPLDLSELQERYVKTLNQLTTRKWRRATDIEHTQVLYSPKDVGLLTLFVEKEPKLPTSKPTRLTREDELIDALAQYFIGKDHVDFCGAWTGKTYMWIKNASLPRVRKQLKLTIPDK